MRPGLLGTWALLAWAGLGTGCAAHRAWNYDESHRIDEVISGRPFDSSSPAAAGIGFAEVLSPGLQSEDSYRLAAPRSRARIRSRSAAHRLASTLALPSRRAGRAAGTLRRASLLSLAEELLHDIDRSRPEGGASRSSKASGRPDG